MSNELAALVVLVAWLSSGRGVNLCLVILFYYLGYMFIHCLTVHLPALYFFSQSCLDAVIICFCYVLVSRYGHEKWVCGTYAALVYTSLICDGLRLIDQGAASAIAYDLYNLRQEYSIFIDMIFMIMGSNGISSIHRGGDNATRRLPSRNTTNNKAKKV